MARDRSRLRLEPLTIFGMPTPGPVGAGLIPITGQQWFVDPNGDVAPWKKAWGTGKGEDRPFATLEEALAACQTGDTIYITGNIREEGLIGSNLKFDVKIVGVGGLHHPDQPSSAYHPGAAMIRPPASPTAVTPLITLRGRGWQFHNVAFDGPVDAAAVVLSRNALSTTSEYDASHAVFKTCRFLSGIYGIEDAGGANHVIVDDCEFAGMSGVGIYGSSTAVANPRAWQVRRCYFPSNVSGLGNATHIDLSLNESLIVDSIFGTVISTGLYINLTGGNGNVVTQNTLGGAYTTADYVPGTGDLWLGNWVTVVSTQAPNGFTITVPAA